MCYVKCQGTNKILLEGKLKQGLYAFENIHFPAIDDSDNKDCNLVASCSKNVSHLSLSTWHAGLGHPSPKIVTYVLRKCNIVIDINKIPVVFKAYCLGKLHKMPFSTSTTVYDTPLQLIYSYIWGPFPIPSTNGTRYYIHFIDAHTKYTWIYLLQNKSQALQSFIHFKTHIENLTRHNIKALQTDNGREYIAFF